MVNNNTQESILNVVKDSSEQYKNYGVQGDTSNYNNTKQWKVVGKIQGWKYTKVFYTNQTDNSNNFMMPLVNMQTDYSKWYKVMLKQRDRPDKNKAGTFPTDYTYDVMQWIEEVAEPQGGGYQQQQNSQQGQNRPQAFPTPQPASQPAPQPATTNPQPPAQTFNQGQSTNVPSTEFKQDTTPSIIFQSLLKCAVTVVGKYPGNYQNADDMWADAMKLAYNSIVEAGNPLVHRDKANNFSQENNDIQKDINNWNQS